MKSIVIQLLCFSGLLDTCTRSQAQAQSAALSMSSSASATLDIGTINIDRQLQQLFNDPKCDKECLGFCLSYFPSEVGVQKCGCSQALVSAGGLEQQRQKYADGGEKFFQNSIDFTMVDPIIQEYKNQLRAIDFDILSQGLSDASVLTQQQSDGSASKNTLKVGKNKNQTGGKNNTKKQNITKPPVHQFCNPDDEKCLEMLSQCVATCTQKCKSEPQDKRSSCVKLCKNQCMASYKVKSDQTENSYDYSYYDEYSSEPGALGTDELQLLSEEGETAAAFNRARTHASYLQEQGDLCQPSCVAKCGHLILSSAAVSLAARQEESAAAIVRCFKQDCQCQSKFSTDLAAGSGQLMDLQAFKKYQKDLQVEHLLLEKEVQDAIFYVQGQPQEQQSGSSMLLGQQHGMNSDVITLLSAEDYSEESTVLQADMQNTLLDSIVKANLRRQRDATLQARSYWLTVTVISLVLIAFAATVGRYTAVWRGNDYKSSWSSLGSKPHVQAVNQSCGADGSGNSATRLTIQAGRIAGSAVDEDDDDERERQGSPAHQIWRNDQRKLRQEYIARVHNPKPVDQELDARRKNLTQKLL